MKHAVGIKEYYSLQIWIYSGNILVQYMNMSHFSIANNFSERFHTVLSHLIFAGCQTSGDQSCIATQDLEKILVARKC